MHTKKETQLGHLEVQIGNTYKRMNLCWGVLEDRSNPCKWTFELSSDITKNIYQNYWDTWTCIDENTKNMKKEEPPLVKCKHNVTEFYSHSAWQFCWMGGVIFGMILSKMVTFKVWIPVKRKPKRSHYGCCTLILNCV